MTRTYYGAAIPPSTGPRPDPMNEAPAAEDVCGNGERGAANALTCECPAPSDTAKAIAKTIYQKYHQHYDGEIQGCCPLITDEICRATGAVPIAGEITFYGGSHRRTHWWAEKDGVTLDPMGDAMMDPRDYPERVEVHRDSEIFEAILPQYEQWRIA